MHIKMQRISSWINKHKGSAFFALGISALIAFLYVYFMYPLYETSDDPWISYFVSGALIEKDAHTICINYILGWILNILYGLRSTWPWYGMAQIVTVALSLAAVTYVIMNRFRFFPGLFLTVMMQVYVGYECYICMQFTKTAGVATAAGCLLIMYAVSLSKFGWKIYWICIGSIIAAVGSMYRFQQFMACVAVMSGLGVFYLLQRRKDDLQSLMKGLLQHLAAFGFLLIISLAAYEVDQIAYNSDPVWSEARQFNYARALLLDHGVPSWDDYQEQYEELGINHDAYIMLIRWDLADNEVFTTDVLKQIRLFEKPQVFTASEWIEKFFAWYPLKYIKNNFSWLILAGLLVWLLQKKHGLADILTLIYELLLITAINFYFFYRGRYLMHRVDMSVMFSFFLVMIWISEEAGVGGFIRGKIANAASTLAVVVASYMLMWNTTAVGFRLELRTPSEYMDNMLAVRDAQRILLYTIRNDKEHLYLAKSWVPWSASSCFWPMDVCEQKLLENLLFFGGWDMYTKPYMDSLEKYGLKNPLRDLIDNDKVYIADYEIDLTLRYLEHYTGKKVKAEPVERYLDIDVYRIVSDT